MTERGCICMNAHVCTQKEARAQAYANAFFRTNEELFNHHLSKCLRPSSHLSNLSCPNQNNRSIKVDT